MTETSEWESPVSETLGPSELKMQIWESLAFSWCSHCSGDQVGRGGNWSE